jgi:hypothetical protein
MDQTVGGRAAGLVARNSQASSRVGLRPDHIHAKPSSDKIGRCCVTMTHIVEYSSCRGVAGGAWLLPGSGLVDRFFSTESLFQVDMKTVG